MLRCPSIQHKERFKTAVIGFMCLGGNMPSPTLYERGDKLVELAKINWIVWQVGGGMGICASDQQL